MVVEEPQTKEISGAVAHQVQIPFAVVQGSAITELPQDLYIPPDALEVILDAFEGPLDLLLYLIRRQNLDILDIPVAEITLQYVAYIEMLQEIRFELAAEYLVMAAILAEIKSRMLLPRAVSDEGEVDDPRAELIRRLQEYEQFKQAAADIDELPRNERDFALAGAWVEDRNIIRIPPEVDLKELLTALADVLNRADLFNRHQIQREPLSVRERMTRIITTLRETPYTEFHNLFTSDEGRMGVVVTFLALLELLKEQLAEIVQNEPLGIIYVKSLAATE
ncbi:MAG: segregation/condensation protein A [Xanthomonadales bacterium]|nr:segregation/condensation protein A [Xanthomonadales bacterium]